MKNVLKLVEYIIPPGIVMFQNLADLGFLQKLGFGGQQTANHVMSTKFIAFAILISWSMPVIALSELIKSNLVLG